MTGFASELWIPHISTLVRELESKASPRPEDIIGTPAPFLLCNIQRAQVKQNEVKTNQQTIKNALKQQEIRLVIQTSKHSHVFFLNVSLTQVISMCF